MEGWGADWKYIDKDSQNNVWEIDTANISHEPNNIVSGLIKTTYSKESIKNYVKKFGKEFNNLSYCKKIAEYYCKEKRTRTVNINWYSLDGKIVYSGNFPSEWEFVVSDSLGESIFMIVCQ